MSAKLSANLWCDHPDCADADAFATGINDYPSKAAVRAAARQRGWTHIRHAARRRAVDLCPEHGKAFGVFPDGTQ